MTSEFSNNEYEFDDSQNELIQTLASTMKFVGYFLIAVGVLTGISGILSIAQGGFVGLVQGVVQGIIGFWTMRAAQSFQLIVDTEGRDIENLMGALGELRKLYGLQYWILIIALIFVVIGLIVGIISGVFSN